MDRTGMVGWGGDSGHGALGGARNVGWWRGS